MTKPVILTGLRANNDLTIGNYFGAMKPMIDMIKNKSDNYQINMFIPDLHSLTTEIDYTKLHDQIIHNSSLFVAAGLPLDNDNIYIYRQSYIPAHSELTWILDCFSGFGELSRMTQFKEKSGDISDKSEKQKFQKRVSVGLFNYPVLMAADILLYNSKYIPIGEDQAQHLEFTRDIAMRMNNKFGNIFTVPESTNDQYKFFNRDQGLRIKDLVDPSKKMSKSDESGKGVIFLGDDPSSAHKKIMTATTDNISKINFDRSNQPGISNLLEILSLIRGQDLNSTVREFSGQRQYGNFKQIVANEVSSFLSNFQNNLENINYETIIQKIDNSEKELSEVANETLLKVQTAVGLRQKVL